MKCQTIFESPEKSLYVDIEVRLSLLNPSIPFPNSVISVSLSTVTSQTVAFQDIGYKGEIGYQTFLYSNEPEIRSLLMFLVEKLPRESAEASDQPQGTPPLYSHRKEEMFNMYCSIVTFYLCIYYLIPGSNIILTVTPC